MKVISVVSTKGSVGKTTLVIHIAGYLASIGKRVLLIDADSQQSLSRFFDYKDLDPHIAQNGFGKWFTAKEEVSAEQFIYQTANHDNIDIIVNDDPKKYLVSKHLRDTVGAVYKMPSLIKQIRDLNRYNYVLIDTEGTDGRGHDGNSIQNAVILANPDLVLSVTKTKLQFAMEVVRVIDVYHSAANSCKHIDREFSAPLKFVVNEHDRARGIANEVLANLREAFEEFSDAELLQTIVPLKKKFFETYYHQKIFAHDYKDKNLHDPINVVIRDLCEELFPEIVPETGMTSRVPETAEVL